LGEIGLARQFLRKLRSVRTCNQQRTRENEEEKDENNDCGFHRYDGRGVSMRRNAKLCVLLACCLVIQGCALAELGALEEGAIAVEGTELAGGFIEAEADAGIGARIAAEAAESGRVLAPRGALGRALGQLADADSVVGIDRLGRITQQGRYLATIEADGSLTAEGGSGRVLVGRVAEGELYEVSSNGARAVARLRGFVPSRGIRLMSTPGTGATSLQILHDEVAAEILRIQDGWYEIRLPDNTTGWVWGPAVAALLIQRDNGNAGTCRCSDAPGAVVLKTGEIIQYQTCEEFRGAVTLHTTAGRAITVDRGLIQTTLCGQDARVPVEGQRVELTTGVVIYAQSIVPTGQAALITMKNGERLSVDRDLVSEPALNLSY
jgi:hypothetical protein